MGGGGFYPQKVAELGEINAAASTSPVPPPMVVPTPAPGKRESMSAVGAKTNYTRVNTGAPPLQDPVSGAQKTMPPRGAEMLPKLASVGGEVFMKVTTRPVLQDLVKTAMNESLARADVTREANVQAERAGAPAEKTAAVVVGIPVEKLANALDFLADEFRKEAEPGEGPGALRVMQAEASTPLPDHKGQGHNVVPMRTGTQKGLPTEQGGTMVPNDLHHTPAAGQKAPLTNYGKHAGVASFLLQKMAEDESLETQEGKGMAQVREGLNKAESAHAKEKQAGEEGVAPTAAAPRPKATLGQRVGAGLLGGYPGMLGGQKAVEHGHGNVEGALRGAGGYTLGALPGAAAGGALGYGAGHLLHIDPALTGMLGASVGSLGGGIAGYKHLTRPMGVDTPELAARMGGGQEVVAHVLASIKQAEDAINPAQISAGKAVPPETSASGQPGGNPVGGAPQGATGLIDSNQAAINFKRQAAYADKKTDLGKYWKEPALTQSTDSVLQNAFAHAGEASSKMASADSVEMSVKVAAGRALLQKLAGQVTEEKQAARA